MLSSLYTRKNRDDGFTLIELLVVVIIIGVLAAIALPIFIDQSKTAVDASIKSDVRNTVTNVNNWRAQHDANLPASAEAYAAAGGKLALSKGAYVNVAFTADNDYVVCGYNPGGKNYADYKHAWAFTASTGQFTNLADISGECTDAVHVRTNLDDTSEDNAGTAAGGAHVATVQNADGSSIYLAYDPAGKTGNPAGGGNPGGGTPGGGTGGGSPTTPDPTGTNVSITNLSTPNNYFYDGAIKSRGGMMAIFGTTQLGFSNGAYNNYVTINSGSKDAVLKSTGTPAIDGLKAGDTYTGAATNVKVLDKNGNPVTTNIGTCEFKAAVVDGGSSNDLYGARLSCDWDGNSYGPVTGTFDSYGDATITETEDGSVTFTDAQGRANTLKIGNPFYYGSAN